MWAVGLVIVDGQLIFLRGLCGYVWVCTSSLRIKLNGRTQVEIIHTKSHKDLLTLTVLVTTIDAQWEGMGDVGSARYEPALLPPSPAIRVLSYSN